MLHRSDLPGLDEALAQLRRKITSLQDDQWRFVEEVRQLADEIRCYSDDPATQGDKAIDLTAAGAHLAATCEELIRNQDELKWLEKELKH